MRGISVRDKPKKNLASYCQMTHFEFELVLFTQKTYEQLPFSRLDRAIRRFFDN